MTAFSAELWNLESMGAWVFVTLPLDLSLSIKEVPRPPAPGFGSLRVVARIGDTEWRTSIFPEAKTGCYVLPVKKAVRAAEGVSLGDTVTVSLELVD